MVAIAIDEDDIIIKMDFRLVKICTTVPQKNSDAIREALGKAGAGAIGNYSYCSFSVTGKGRFKPNKEANPHIGTANKLEIVEEEQIEVVCERVHAKQIIEALKKAHPYEEPIIDIFPLIDEEDL
jgi:hypothetical protein